MSGDKNGLVLALLLLTGATLSTVSLVGTDDGAAVVVGALLEGSVLPVKKLSEKSVSLCSPASPFSEKCVTLMGSETLEGERGVSREEMVRRSTAAGWSDTVVVVRVGELSTSIS